MMRGKFLSAELKGNLKLIGLLFLAFGFFSAAPALALTQPAQIYIRQVQTTGGKNNTTSDFVELFNPNSTPANLKGYRLVKRSANASSDTTIKVWDKDALIPAKSFYLWANSGYTSIAVKPDVTSSASLADDSGVALRFGPSNTGALIDSLAWGKANNGFPNVSQINPGANMAVYRQSWYAPTSGYYIAGSNPFNSLTTDFAGAYAGSVAPPQNPPPSPSPLPKNPTPPAANTNPAQLNPVPTDQGTASSLGENLTTPIQPDAANPPAQSYGGASPKNYLILSAAALIVLIFLAYKFLFSKRK